MRYQIKTTSASGHGEPVVIGVLELAAGMDAEPAMALLRRNTWRAEPVRGGAADLTESAEADSKSAEDE